MHTRQPWEGPADAVARPRPPLTRAAAALGLALSVAPLLMGCSEAEPIAPVAPDVIQLTPLALVAGVLPTPTVTPGPSTTPTAYATRVATPPEPLHAPRHFGVSVFAEGLGAVRMMAYAPNHDLFATVSNRDRVLVLPDRDLDGIADAVYVFAEGEGLNQPHGIAFQPGWLYVANTDAVVRLPYEPGDVVARGSPEMVVPLPGEGVNWMRSLLFDQEGAMYVAVGSSCDVFLESDARHASVLRFSADGTQAVLFATGLRQAVGMAQDPVTGTIWLTDAGRDGLGQNRPPAELNRLVAGGNYGWPYCYGDGEADGDLPSGKAYCKGTIGPTVKFAAHAAPHGIAFYTGTQFPEKYAGGLFVAQHGTWREVLPTGYSVVFLPFIGGEPTGELERFVDGWLMPDTRRWGSPVDLVMAPDGALLLSDDGGGRIYRIYYHGPYPTSTPEG